MTTNRTAIRRRLAVRRTSHRPPWGARKAGHHSIVAPLAATVAATVAVGVGVALARAGRDRHLTGQAPPDRDLGLLRDEQLADGMRRMALAQADLAMALLSGRHGGLEENAVHETRKALKRLRAILRMLRAELGEKTFARENAALRRIAARLSGARDAEVMMDTLDALIKRNPRELKRRPGVVKLRRRLRAEKKRLERQTLTDEVMRAEVLAELRAFRGRVAAWQLPERPGTELVETGLGTIYRQGRRRYRRAARGKGDRTRALHEWRKRVKDLRHAAEALERREAAGKKRGRRGRSTSAAKNAAELRRLARRADRLGEMLGEDHDLAVLTELIAAARGGGRPREARIGKRTQKLLLKLIERRRAELRRRALRAGKRVYKSGPSRFVRSVRRAYRSDSS